MKLPAETPFSIHCGSCISYIFRCETLRILSIDLPGARGISSHTWAACPLKSKVPNRASTSKPQILALGHPHVGKNVILDISNRDLWCFCCFLIACIPVIPNLFYKSGTASQFILFVGLPNSTPCSDAGT